MEQEHERKQGEHLGPGERALGDRIAAANQSRREPCQHVNRCTDESCTEFNGPPI